MPIYAKSAKEGEEKERLAEHTIKDIQAGRVLVKNLPFGKDKKKRIGTDLDETIAFHDVGSLLAGFRHHWKRALLSGVVDMKYPQP